MQSGENEPVTPVPSCSDECKWGKALGASWGASWGEVTLECVQICTPTQREHIDWRLWFVSCQTKWANKWQTRGDFHILVPARTVGTNPTGLQHAGAEFRHPNIHRTSGSFRLWWDCHIPAECLHCAGAIWEKEEDIPSEGADVKVRHLIWVPVWAAVSNDGQVLLVITKTHRKSQHCPEETRWWWETATRLWW